MWTHSGLPFQQVQHVVTTVDVQPVPAVEGAIIVQILGQLKVNEIVRLLWELYSELMEGFVSVVI